jgi:hypothetical protein
MAATQLANNIAVRDLPGALIPIAITGTDASTTLLASVAAGFTVDIWGFRLTAYALTDLDFQANSVDISGIIGSGIASALSLIEWKPPIGQFGVTKAAPFCSGPDGVSPVLTNSGSAKVQGVVWVNVRPTSR